MLWLAASNFPVRSVCASVNEPFTWPKSSLSKRDSVMAPMSTATISSCFREDRACISRASISFPVPFSPVIRMFTSVLATFSISCRNCCMALLSPQYMAPSSFFAFLFFPLLFMEAAACNVSTSFWLSHGFTTKSLAPSLIPRTARSMSA